MPAQNPEPAVGTSERANHEVPLHEEPLARDDETEKDACPAGMPVFAKQSSKKHIEHKELRLSARLSISLDKRNFIAREISSTEFNYLKKLELILEAFEAPLGSTDFLPPPVLHALFPPSLRTIATISQQLVSKLESCLGESRFQIGPIFIDVANSMKVYTDYINNYETAIHTLKDLSKTYPKAQAFIRDTERSPLCKKSSLEDLLICVIQRIPQYVLLLRDLLVATPASHHDHGLLKEALEKMKVVADYINSEKQKHENRQRAIALFKDWDMEARITATRVCIYECQVFKDLPPSTKEERQALAKTIHIYFFNDLIFIQKISNDFKKLTELKVSEVVLGRPLLGATHCNRFRLEAKAYYVLDGKTLLAMVSALHRHVPGLQIFKEEIDDTLHHYNPTKPKKKKDRFGVISPRMPVFADKRTKRADRDRDRERQPDHKEKEDKRDKRPRALLPNEMKASPSPAHTGSPAHTANTNTAHGDIPQGFRKSGTPSEAKSNLLKASPTGRSDPRLPRLSEGTRSRPQPSPAGKLPPTETDKSDP